MSLYKHLKKARKNNRKLLAILIDPDKINLKDLSKTAKRIEKAKADFVLVGGSLLSNNHLDKLIKKLKKKLAVPVFLFPGNALQISRQADGILFLSLLSGRNPDFLIGNQVLAAPVLHQTDLEIIPTGYILIENGHTTSVEYMSQTKPIPRNKTDIAVATALAGQMLGNKLIYLEAGSGAKDPVPLQTIRQVNQNIKIPLMVGGGIRTRTQILSAWNAGADIVVVGTAFENGTL